jgi:hypothetical protein
LFASLDGGSTLVAEETTYREEFQRGSPPPLPASLDPSVDEEDREPDDPCRLMESVHGSDDKAETLPKDDLEWDSDNDNILSFDVTNEDSYWGMSLDILGFHPYKKVVYLTEPFGVLAYNLDTSNVQYLGNSRPKCYYRNHSNGIYESFVYTPCMVRET